MIEYTLKIGDVVASPGNAQYTCFGLGSCIGLFIQDRTRGLTAGAHILLPEDEQGPDDKKFYNVQAALNEILTQLEQLGSDLGGLRAKLTGGANVIGINTATGLKNAESVVNHLTARKIFIAALDVGGVQSRTARFQSTTGSLTVKLAGTNEYKVY